MKYLKTCLYIIYKFLYRIPKRFRRKFWETNIDNQYYGHYNIMKIFSETLLPYKINGEIQHGWSPDTGIINPNTKDKDIKLRRYYLINKSNQKKSIKKGFLNTIIIGAPFLYLLDMIKHKVEELPKSLLLFPIHSHEWVSFLNPIKIHQDYIIEIKKIKPFFKFITVSLGWKEYQNKDLIKLFTNEGIKVITMGHRDNNPEFLLNFYNHVSQYEYVSSDTYSSAVFYSLFMKKKVFIYGKPLNRDFLFLDKKSRNANSWDGPGNSYYEYYTKIYSIILWENFNHKSNFEIAKIELGLNYKKSAKEIREIFGWTLKDFFKSFFI